MTHITYLKIPEDKAEEFIRFANIFTHDPYTDHELLAHTLGGKMGEILPPNLLQALHELVHSQIQAIVISGMPIDANIPRADLADVDVKKRMQLKSRVSEKTILGVASLMGFRLDSNPKEQEGRIIHNVHPVPEKEGKGPSSQSSDPFYLHVENPFDKNPPEYIMLLALEGDSKSKTTLFLIDHILQELPNWVVESMKKPEFEIRSGSGFDAPEKGIFPLIEFHENTNRYRLRIYQESERIRGITHDAEIALKFIFTKFKNIIRRKPEKVMAISLNPGEAVIFNNCYGLEKIAGMMHGRSGLIENKKRWLQRAFFYQQNSEWRNRLSNGSFNLIRAVINKSSQYNLRHVADHHASFQRLL